MMKNVKLICCAEALELALFLKSAKVKNKKFLFANSYQALLCCEFRNQIFYLLYTGVGKTNAACSLTYALSLHPEINQIINCGPAGSTFDSKIGEKYLIEKCNYYDIDLTGLPNYKLGQLPDKNVYFDVYNLHKKLEKLNFKKANCATADRFAKMYDADIIANSFENKPYLVDMECAALAHVASLFSKPFLAIKIISDVITNKNHLEYIESKKIWEKSCADALLKILEVL
ncbi:5'-methylthioadenosine/S-adenosylhomocysteine nucleosidase family protein [Metamycoplasma equirhinis]|uniref:5'-methylthioadenosine/S-adenosylhomocysteine nucleosidase family protein n=1 Tax=Metamycoplasma equirhinis TaxID=92402 RepID=UPI0035947555